MKHLHGIIEKLEKKLGFESGFCLHVKPGNGELDAALSRIKIVDLWDSPDIIENLGPKGKENEKMMEIDMNSLVNELPGRLVSGTFD